MEGSDRDCVLVAGFSADRALAGRSEYDAPRSASGTDEMVVWGGPGAVEDAGDAWCKKPLSGSKIAPIYGLFSRPIWVKRVADMFPQYFRRLRLTVWRNEANCLIQQSLRKALVCEIEHERPLLQ
jgi:hypothetical protein